MNYLTIRCTRDSATITATRRYCLTFNRGIHGPPGLDGVYGSPVLTSIIPGTTYVIPAGKQLDSIAVIPAAGARTITIGYTASATQIADTEDVNSNQSLVLTIKKYYHTVQTIHFSGFTGSVRIYLL